VKGQSGNPAGMAKGRAHKATEAVRRLISENSAAILTKVIEQAKSGDSQAQATFIKLIPKHRFVATPTELKPAKDSDEAKLQINKLVAMCASGLLDLDGLKTLTDALRVSIDGRQSELEALVRELVEKQEGSAA
jgi:Family of unknown function (DUF5681)